MRLARVWLAFTLAAYVADCQPERQIGGMLESFSGPVYWRAGASAKAAPLDPKLDSARILFTGEGIRCGPGGEAKLQLASGPLNLHESARWFTVPEIGTKPVPGDATSERAEINQRALENYGRRAGRERGGGAPVYSPADGSTVRVKDFVIRWNPSPAMTGFSIALRTARDVELWREDGVNGAAGKLDSPRCRAALERFAADDGFGELELKVVDARKRESGVRFSLLAPQREKALEEALAEWNVGMLRHVGRAYVFDFFQMYNASADEYEAALLEAPASRDLLLAAIAANHRTGNLGRVRELIERLPAKERAAVE